MARQTPDVILYGGDIRTQDPRKPRAEALAIKGERIVALGREGDVLRLAGRDTRRVHLEGRLALPAFVDSHFHLYEYARSRQGLNVGAAGSLAELQAMLRQAADERPGTGRMAWITGHGLNEAVWEDARIPTRVELDAACPDHPVYLTRCDLHLAVANSRALQLARVGENTKDPKGGTVERDERGRPTGLLCEAAMELVSRRVPAPTDLELADAYRVTFRDVQALGITGLEDSKLRGRQGEAAMSLRVLGELSGEELFPRIRFVLPGERLEDALEMGMTSGFGSEALSLSRVKYYLDGSMGARTAWMTEPYLDHGPEHAGDGLGETLTGPEELARCLRLAEAGGLALMIHAIGDRACGEIATLFEEYAAEAGGERPRASRMGHRVEHLQCIRPLDAGRLGELCRAGGERPLLAGACVQPANLLDDMEMALTSVGPERTGGVYAFRLLRDAGIPLAFGSDCPVCDPDPLLGVLAAVTRRRSGAPGDQPFHPEQRLSLDEAFRAATRTSAQLSGLGEVQGMLAPGYSADVVVLEQNPYEVAAQDITEGDDDALAHCLKSNRVAMTLQRGRLVHQV